MIRHGFLSDYFKGIAAKRLSAVEADSGRSNQHEFNGVSSLKQLFGPDRKKIPAQFILLGENEDDTIKDNGILTWYDARENHPTRSEHRLYFPTTAVSEIATEGDLLVIGLRADNSVLAIIAQKETSSERQIKWLFGLSDDSETFEIREITPKQDTKLNFAGRSILSLLEIEVDNTDDNYLDRMIQKFGGDFPNTSDFSAFVITTITDLNPSDNPDQLLMRFMDQEEMLFKTLERHIVAQRLEKDFQDVEEFLAYSLSVQNRRKSRAGNALENHVEWILTQRKVAFSHNQITENNSRPDFIFPSIEKYRNFGYPSNKLTVMGVKRTCKDRWRQVLAEASRIENKHLLTLEPAISENQTEEMKANKLQLVVPRDLHNTYLPAQQSWLFDLSSFIDMVIRLQSS